MSYNDEFLRNKYSTGLLRVARNDALGERRKKEVVVAPQPTQIVIASNAKQSSANNARPSGLQTGFIGRIIYDSYQKG